METILEEAEFYGYTWAASFEGADGKTFALGFQSKKQAQDWIEFNKDYSLPYSAKLVKI